MMKKDETIKTYFSLFDTFTDTPDALNKIVSLFNEHATIIAADGNVIRGKQFIEQFFIDFFTLNTNVTHTWHLNTGSGYSADWSAVVTTKSDRKTLTSKGTDYYEFDDEGKIQQLKMVLS